jgi:hypothetical protein
LEAVEPFLRLTLRTNSILTGCIMAPAPVFDYIVIHEFCHLIHRNHSKDFWDMVGRIFPDYERRKEWLKNYGIKLDL